LPTYVLVPGAWLGGWVWHEVAARLRAAGHEVFPVTLTGLGERSHLARPDIDLETHITDVINVLTWNDLTGVILAGHSYAGTVITGVADRVPERIAQLVYVDSAPLADGVAMTDLYPPRRLPACNEPLTSSATGGVCRFRGSRALSRTPACAVWTSPIGRCWPPGPWRIRGAPTPSHCASNDKVHRRTVRLSSPATTCGAWSPPVSPRSCP
jgi:pimeloyl-ACP methyl ester carboxylesterase